MSVDIQSQFSPARQRRCSSHLPARRGFRSDSRWLVFRNMNQRCYYKKDIKFRWYGGRGIIVCKRWRSWPARYEQFINFCQDMGRRLSLDMTIDRIDPDGHYTSKNCRWLARKENTKRRVPLKNIGIYKRRALLLYWGYIVCSRCKVTKKCEEFNLTKKRKWGYFSYCKQCCRILGRQPSHIKQVMKWYWKNREYCIKKMRERRRG